MSGNEDSREREAKEAHSRLDEGLKNCRAVVSNYRALLDRKPRKRAAKDGGKDIAG